VVTCAHVVHGGQAITVTGADGTSYPAQVASPLLAADDPKARFYPLPDVALLRVAGLPAGHPCVRFDLAEPVTTPRPDVFRLDAHTKGEHAEDAVVHSGAAPEFEGPALEDGWRLYKLRAGQVVGGFSGGPLLNRRTGGVCAMVDSSRGERTDLGGFGIPNRRCAGRTAWAAGAQRSVSRHRPTVAAGGRGHCDPLGRAGGQAGGVAAVAGRARPGLAAR
jgi:hypothetical protein